MKAQNHAINFLKLFFLAVIVLHHSGIALPVTIYRGYIGVEFFFIVSGYFLYKTYIKKASMTLPVYAQKRFSKLYPHYLFSFAAMAIFYNITHTEYDKSFLAVSSEILMLQNTGIFTNGGINYPCWYLSVLMFASLLVYGFFRISNKPVRIIFSIVCISATYSYIFATRLRLETFSTVSIFYLPFWRGVAGILLGALACEIQKALSDSFFERGVWLTRIIECASFIGIASIFFIDYPADLIVTFLTFVLIIAVSSPYSVINKLSDNIVFKWLIKYEYAIFLNHALVLKAVEYLNIDRQLLKLLTVALVLIAYSVITTKLVDWCFGKTQKLFSRAFKKQTA